jgi:hypothetical protein
MVILLALLAAAALALIAPVALIISPIVLVAGLAIGAIFVGIALLVVVRV